VGALVRHDLPEPRRASKGPESELDPKLPSHEAAERPAEAGIRHDSDAGERGSVPQAAEPPEDPLDASDLCPSKGGGRGPVHGLQMLAG